MASLSFLVSRWQRCILALGSLLLAPALLAQPADQLLHNARIYTLDPDQPWADTIAMAGDRIIYVGDYAGARPHLVDATRQTDLDGKLVLPGFIDTHMHIGETIPYVFAAALGPGMNPEQLLAAIAGHAAAYPEQNPVPGVHYYKRHPDGTPTGWLIEGGAFAWVSQKLGVITEASLEAGADQFLGTLSAMGITAAFDAGLIEGGEKTLALFDRLVAEDRLPLRVVGSLYVNTATKLASAPTDLARLQQHYPLRSIAAGDARITLGSDYPASWIGLDGLNPLFNIEMGMTRRPAGDPDFQPQPLASEVITLEQAIRGYTLDAAWQLGLEDQIGSLQVGKQADLVVLSDNLFEMAPHAIHTARVLTTMVDGKTVYSAE